MASLGVFIKRVISLLKYNMIKVKPKAMIKNKTIAPPIVFDKSRYDLLPKYCPNKTVTPVVSPKTRFVIKAIV